MGGGDVAVGEGERLETRVGGGGEECEDGWRGGGEGREVQGGEHDGETKGERAIERRREVRFRPWGARRRPRGREGVEAAGFEGGAPLLDDGCEASSDPARLDAERLEVAPVRLEEPVETRELDRGRQNGEGAEAEPRSSLWVCQLPQRLSHVPFRLDFAEPPPPRAHVLAYEDNMTQSGKARQDVDERGGRDTRGGREGEFLEVGEDDGEQVEDF